MADRRRIVTMSQGGRPVLEVDLEVGATYQAIAETFAYQPGADNPMMSKEPGRFGGQVTVGESVDNGAVSWQALVSGSTYDLVAANVEALLVSVNRNLQGRLLEWRPDGATYSCYARLAGPGTWKPTYKWAQWQGAQSMVVDVSFPVRPLWLWDQMTIYDPFDVDSRADYTYDTGAIGDFTAAGGSSGKLVFTGSSPSTERLIRHTARGYMTLEGQATIRATPTGTISGFKAGVRLRASATQHVAVYVDDNGTNSRLRIDVVSGGVTTNRFTTNLGARIINGNEFTVRGRIEGQTVYAEYWTLLAVQPSPMATPTSSGSYNLTGGEQATFTAGHAGVTLIPGATSAAVDGFEFMPFTYRNLTLPQAFEPLDQIPGSAPALVDARVTPSGGSATPAWAQIAWAGIDGRGFTANLPAIFEAEDMTLSGWASNSTASAHVGRDVRASGPGTFTASFDIDPSYTEADDFTDGDLDVEVWARVLVSSTLVNPRIKLTGGYYNSPLSLIVGSRGTVEYGNTGKTLTLPSAGSVYRLVRLGVFTLDGSVTIATRFTVTGTVDTGSTGAFGLDYVQVVAAHRRAVSMTGVALASVTPFVPTTNEWIKTVRTDLSGLLNAPDWMPGATAIGGGSSNGLGGNMIQPSPGWSRWLVKLSSLVPDDPTVDASSEQLAHAATVSLDVTPRSYMFRDA